MKNEHKLISIPITALTLVLSGCGKSDTKVAVEPQPREVETTKRSLPLTERASTLLSEISKIDGKIAFAQLPPPTTQDNFWYQGQGSVPHYENNPATGYNFARWQQSITPTSYGVTAFQGWIFLRGNGSATVVYQKYLYKLNRQNLLEAYALKVASNYDVETRTFPAIWTIDGNKLNLRISGGNPDPQYFSENNGKVFDLTQFKTGEELKKSEKKQEEDRIALIENARNLNQSLINSTAKTVADFKLAKKESAEGNLNEDHTDNIRLLSLLFTNAYFAVGKDILGSPQYHIKDNFSKIVEKMAIETQLEPIPKVDYRAFASLFPFILAKLNAATIKQVPLNEEFQRFFWFKYLANVKVPPSLSDGDRLVINVCDLEEWTVVCRKLEYQMFYPDLRNVEQIRTYPIILPEIESVKYLSNKPEEPQYLRLKDSWFAKPLRVAEDHIRSEGRAFSKIALTKGKSYLGPSWEFRVDFKEREKGLPYKHVTVVIDNGEYTVQPVGSAGEGRARAKANKKN